MARSPALLIAVVALAAPTAATIVVNGSDSDGLWAFMMAGTNGGKSGVWHNYQPIGYSHTFDTLTYEFFTPSKADVAEFVAASPTIRSAVGRKLKFRFQEAVDYCRQMHNASLVSLRNRDERNFVISILPNNRHGWWLGLQRNPSGSAERYSNYMDGTPVTYFSWAAEEPTGDDDEGCVFSGQNNGNPSKWVDASCDGVKRRAVCKRVYAPMPPIVTTTTTEEPRTRGQPVGAAAVGIDDYGACYTNDDPTVNAQRSAATEPARANNGFTGNTYKIRNYTGSDIGVDPAVVHYAEPFCCYKYISMPKETWHGAEAQCQAWGAAHHSRGGEGHLARVIDHEMNFFLQRLKIDVAFGTGSTNSAEVRDKVWIGGRVEDGDVVWTDERLFDGGAMQDGWEPWFSSEAAGNASDVRTEPNSQGYSDSCIHIGGSGGPGRTDLTDQSHWSDGNCAQRRPYICAYCSVPDNTEMPTPSPTQSPSQSPTEFPTVGPTISPTAPPTKGPTVSPTESPHLSPTSEPSCAPSPGPTGFPTVSPTVSPSPDRSVCGAYNFLEYTASPGWDGIGGNGGRNSFCCYKHLSPAAGQRMDFTSAQRRCETLGTLIAAEGGQTVYGRGDLAEITGPHMNEWLTTVVYDSASDGNPDKLWIGATNGANGLRWRNGGNTTHGFTGGYPWSTNEPSLRFGRDCSAPRPGGGPDNTPPETQAEFDVRCPVEECVSVGDGTAAGVSTWNDAQCSLRRQAMCQYCYEPPLIPTEEPTTEGPSTTTTTTTEEPDIDCGQLAPPPPTEPSLTPTTAPPSKNPTPAPTTGAPTSVPTVDQGFCTDSNGWRTYDGPDADLGFLGRRSGKAQCCYKYFSASQSGEHKTQSEAQAYCSGLAPSASYPGASNLAFSSSVAVNDFLYTVRDRVFNSENDKSWIAGKVTRNDDGIFVVIPDATESGGTGPDGQVSSVQRFVFANGSNPQYPWYLGEPSMTIYTGNGDASVGGGSAVQEGCVQMGKGRAAIDQGLDRNRWNDALCSKKRPFFCQYCYTPPDAFTDFPTVSPTPVPTLNPTLNPTLTPTNLPTISPTTSNPTASPSVSPTSSSPTSSPSNPPSMSPTLSPTVLDTCSESFAANRILDLMPEYAHTWNSNTIAERWSQTCYGSARNTAAWLCDCFMKMRVADRESLYPNDCRLIDLSDQIGALVRITELLAFDVNNNSATCPNANTPEALVSCSDLHCSNQCRSVADGGSVPNSQQQQCGWSRSRNYCKAVSLENYRQGIGAKTRSNELGSENQPGACLAAGFRNHQERCAEFTCGQDCRSPADGGHIDATGCGWSSRKFACIYGGTTTNREVSAGYCGLRK